MTLNRTLRTAAAAALFAASIATSFAPAHAAEGRNRAAAIGAVAGAAVALGILGASSANAKPLPGTVHVAPPPPPRGYERGRYPLYTETADQAVRACERGIRDAARGQGARNTSLERILRVQPNRSGGHQVQALASVRYGRVTRTSRVVCETRNGYLVSARAI